MQRLRKYAPPLSMLLYPTIFLEELWTQLYTTGFLSDPPPLTREEAGNVKISLWPFINHGEVDVKLVYQHFYLWRELFTVPCTSFYPQRGNFESLQSIFQAVSLSYFLLWDFLLVTWSKFLVDQRKMKKKHKYDHYIRRSGPRGDQTLEPLDHRLVPWDSIRSMSEAL